MVVRYAGAVAEQFIYTSPSKAQGKTIQLSCFLFDNYMIRRKSNSSKFPRIITPAGVIWYLFSTACNVLSMTFGEEKQIMFFGFVVFKVVNYVTSNAASKRSL
jgi:hypothetical protein